MRTRPSRPIALVALIMTPAACTGGDDAAPATSAPATAAESAVRTTIVPATHPTVTTASSTTTVPATNTTTPTRAFAASTCAQLRTAGYGTRKRLVRRAGARLRRFGETGSVDDVLGQECPRALAWVRGAMEIERRARRLSGSDRYDYDFSCDGRRFAIEAVNNTSEPLSVHASAWVELIGGDTRYDSADQPLVIWRVRPGERERASATYTGTSTEYECHARILTFLGDRTRADASIPGAAGPPTRGGNPARWFPAFVEAERRALGSGDPERFLDVQDVRGLARPELFRTLAEHAAPRRLRRAASVQVCRTTIRRSGRHHIAFIALLRYGTGDQARAFLQSGMFRRGRDGRWRRIGVPGYVNTIHYWNDCRPPWE